MVTDIAARPVVDVVAWAQQQPAWKARPQARGGLVETRAKELAGSGVLYVGQLSDPVVDRAADVDGAPVRIPEGYLRLGTCVHVPDAAGRLVATFAPERRTTVQMTANMTLGRVLVQSTLTDVAGPIHVITVIPRCRANWRPIEVGRDRPAPELDIYMYYDEDVRYAARVLFGGVGWDTVTLAAAGTAGR